MRCLAKDPADRHGGAEVLRAHLEDCALAGAWRTPEARHWWTDHARLVHREPKPVPKERQTLCIAACRQRLESGGPAAGTADTVMGVRS